LLTSARAAPRDPAAERGRWADLTTRRHPLWIALAACLIAPTLLACGVKRVSFEEANKLGESYFQALRDGDTRSAMQFYSSEFADSAFRATWEGFLLNKEQTVGQCTKHAVVSSRFAPRVHTATPGVSELCFVLQYDVSYSRGGDRETLTMCPDRLDGTLRIIGHELDRGGGKHVAAGSNFQEQTLKIGG